MINYAINWVRILTSSKLHCLMYCLAGDKSFFFLSVVSFVSIMTLCCFSSVILGKSHYVLFNLVSAMQPRMLVTFDTDLRPLPVSVRVGQVRVINRLSSEEDDGF